MSHAKWCVTLWGSDVQRDGTPTQRRQQLVNDDPRLGESCSESYSKLSKSLRQKFSFQLIHQRFRLLVALSLLLLTSPSLPQSIQQSKRTKDLTRKRMPHQDGSSGSSRRQPPVHRQGRGRQGDISQTADHCFKYRRVVEPYSQNRGASTVNYSEMAALPANSGFVIRGIAHNEEIHELIRKKLLQGTKNTVLADP